MSATDRAPLAALALLAACDGPGQPLSRLIDRWGDQTVEIAGPAITAVLVLGGLAAELCAAGDASAWEGLGEGDRPPVSDALQAALGDPLLVDVSVTGGGSLQAELSGVHIMDREAARLRLFTTEATSVFGFEATVFDGKQENPELAGGEPFGRVALEVLKDCAPGRNRVSGSAQWTDLAERTHQLSLPSDADLGNGVGFQADVPYLPNLGTVAWSGRIDGQERTVSTLDAGDLVPVGGEEGDTGAGPAGAAWWPARVRGADWVTDARVLIAP